VYASRQSLSGFGVVWVWAVVWAGLAPVSCVEPPATAEQEVLDVCALANNGDLCDDHQACTYPDVCMNKKCVGMPVADGTPCTDGNACTMNDHCSFGVCMGTVQADGTACTDGDPCTDPDVCEQGACQPGGPLVCDDGNACTIDSCQTGVGCVFSPRDCGLLPDAGSDAMMTMPDSGGADALVDLVGDVSVADGQLPDAPPVDTGADTAAPDAGADAGPPGMDAAIDADAGSDAGADAEPGVLDAAVDLMGTPPDLRARGGGCACAVEGAGRGEAWLSLALVIAAILVGAGRKSARTRGRQDPNY
jgi:hypothetical protein